MQQFSTHIDPIRLSKILQATFERLPREYYKAIDSFFKARSTTYFRESLISKWISIPANSNIIFKQFDHTHRLTNIFIETIKSTISELQIYLNRHGIIGVELGENLEDLIVDSVDTTNFLIEKVPISKFLTDYTDLEYLEDFSKIDDYLDNKYSSEVYTNDETMYFSIISLSDKNCIVINEKKSVFLLNKISGVIKLISKRPVDFVSSFQNNTLTWLDNI